MDSKNPVGRPRKNRKKYTVFLTAEDHYKLKLKALQSGASISDTVTELIKFMRYEKD